MYYSYAIVGVFKDIMKQCGMNATIKITWLAVGSNPWPG